MNGLIGLLFGMEASFDQSYTVFKGNLRVYKIRVYTSLWNFFINSGLRKFRHGLSTKLGKGVRSERDKLDHRWLTELIIPPSSDARPL